MFHDSNHWFVCVQHILLLKFTRNLIPKRHAIYTIVRYGSCKMRKLVFNVYVSIYNVENMKAYVNHQDSTQIARSWGEITAEFSSIMISISCKCMTYLKDCSFNILGVMKFGCWREKKRQHLSSTQKTSTPPSPPPRSDLYTIVFTTYIYFFFQNTH